MSGQDIRWKEQISIAILSCAELADQAEASQLDKERVDLLLEQFTAPQRRLVDSLMHHAQQHARERIYRGFERWFQDQMDERYPPQPKRPQLRLIQGGKA